jgi:N,N'-diacetylchitobiose transport system substrate-binding protein
MPAHRRTGRLAGIAGVRSAIYRTDAFQELGLKSPTTWGEWIMVGKAIKDARLDLVAMPMAGINGYGVYPSVWGAGGEIATRQDGTWTSRPGSTEARRGIAFYTGLATEHGCPRRRLPRGRRPTCESTSPRANWP